MKNAFKDWITNIFGIGLWAFAVYLKITKPDVGFWEIAGYIAIGGLLFFLNVKELGVLLKQMWDKMLKNKIG